MSNNTRTKSSTASHTNHLTRGGSKKEALSEEMKAKVEAVKRVANWPVEDILRVLEKANNDPEIAINNILDGLENEPIEWEEVVSKRSKAEQTKQKPSQKFVQQRTNRGPSTLNAKPRKDTEKRVETRKKGPRGTERENGETKKPMEGRKQEIAPSSSIAAPATSLPTTSSPQSSPVVTPPVTSVPRTFASTGKSWAAIAQPAPSQPPPEPQPQPQPPSQTAPPPSQPSQPSQPSPPPQPLVSTPPPESLLPPTSSEVPKATPASPSNRPYQPPGMKWKPKESKPHVAVPSKPADKAVTLPTSSLKRMGLDDNNLQFGSFNASNGTAETNPPAPRQNPSPPVSEVSPPLDENQQIPNVPYPPFVHGNHYMPPFAPHFAPFEPTEAMRMSMYDQNYQQAFQGGEGEGKFPREGQVTNPREGKFPPQESGVQPGQPQGQPQGQPPQPFAFPGQPYYFPYQFPSFQNPQQFAYPRYYRGPYPNTSGFAASSMSGYPEEMMPEYNKNMFPMGSGFFPENGASGPVNPANQPQPKQQSYSPPPSAPSATDLNPANFKPQQMPPFQQNPPREQLPSFYNQPQQYGQSQQHWKQQPKQF